MNQHDNPWTEDRTTSLCDLWPTNTTKEISEKLGLSSGCVKGKGRRLGLHKSSAWPEHKVALLREQLGKMSTLELASLLGYSSSSVRKKVQRLGLSGQASKLWSKERDAALRELWEANYTIDIATQLGVTKNSVIGRARRLGLKSKRGEGWGDGVTASKQRANANAERRMQRALKRVRGSAQYEKEKLFRKNSPHDVTLPVASGVEPLLLSIMDLKTNHCRWPYGEAGAIKYCGHQAVSEQSYCHPHYCMSYQPTNPRTRAAVNAEAPHAVRQLTKA